MDGAAMDGSAMDGAARHDFLSSLERDVAACTACRLAAGRTRTVFGTGSEKPLVLVVGEGPGAEEDATGLPFVGPAGKLLDKMLAAIGLSREENVYIANIVKCRPPGNRDPAPDEAAACLSYLERQVDALAPRAILCLGRTAARTLTGAEEGITKLRGRWFEYRGIPLIATFHPSALLREESYKRPAWEDLKALKESLGDVRIP
jgi:DNA polymerase